MDDLKFAKSPHDGYIAEANGKRYRIRKLRRNWRLQVLPLRSVAGVLVADSMEADSMDQTKALCVAVAQAYHQLTDDYEPHRHGHRNRLTEAVRVAYRRGP